MIITAIRRQRGDLYAVYADGEQVALIDSQTLAEAEHIAVGEDVDDEYIDEQQSVSDARRARQKALEIVARKEISSKSLLSKLGSCGFGEDASQSALEEMQRLGFVDDERCAHMMAEDIYHFKHYAARRCAWEMSQRGIDRDLAQQVADELAPDPVEAVCELLRGKLSRDIQSEAGIRRCCNTLARYGYSGSDIREAFSLIDEDTYG